MRVLLTGASGYVGGNIARYLVSRGHSLVLPVRHVAHTRNLPTQSLIEADLSCGLPTDIGRFDAVVHIAAHAPPRPDDSEAFSRDNIRATRNLIEWSKAMSVPRFIFFSSLSVYGGITDNVVDEQTPIRNPGAYGRSKLECEQMLEDDADALPSIMLRLPGLLGPGAPANGVWLARVKDLIDRDMAVSVFNRESPFNNAVWIDSLAEFIETQFDRPWMQRSQSVTLAASTPLPLQDVLRHLSNLRGKGLQLVEGHTGRPSFTISTTLAEQQYGYRPLSLSETISRFAQV